MCRTDRQLKNWNKRFKKKHFEEIALGRVITIQKTLRIKGQLDWMPPASYPPPTDTAASMSSVPIAHTPSFVAQRSWNPWVAFRQWYWPTSEAAALEAQKRLLNRIPSFPAARADAGLSETSRIIARLGLVDLGDGQAINTLVVEQVGTDRPMLQHLGASDHTENDLNSGGEVDDALLSPDQKDAQKRSLVIAHGFGTGLAFFYRNYWSLAQVPGWRLYAIGWLGMGLSSRPPFPTAAKKTFRGNRNEISRPL
jgi:hypothetical protein